MKTNLLRTSMLAVIATAAVYGQSFELQAKVPFDFIVGSRTLHAGQYSVAQRFDSGIVIVKSADHKGTAISMGPTLQSLAARNEGELLFHRYGNTYFLAEVWGAGNYGRQIPKTNRERELAARGPVPVNAVILASR